MPGLAEDLAAAVSILQIGLPSGFHPSSTASSGQVSKASAYSGPLTASAAPEKAATAAYINKMHDVVQVTASCSLLPPKPQSVLPGVQGTFSTSHSGQMELSTAAADSRSSSIVQGCAL